MGFWTSFFTLGLLVGTQAGDYQIVSPFEPVHLDASTTDGGAFSFSDLSVLSADYLPASEWQASAWIYVAEGVSDDIKLLQVTCAGNTPFFVTWPTGSSPSVTYSNEAPNAVVGAPSRPANQWFHIVMGHSKSEQAHVMVTLRKELEAQTWIQLAITIYIDTTFQFKGPVVGEASFTVSSR